MNVVVLLGRIVKDIEVKKTQKETSVVSNTLAVKRSYGKDTDFIDFVAYGNTADFLAQYFQKGRMVAAKGELQTREWEDKEGRKRKNVEVIVEKVDFADSVKSTKDLSQEVEESKFEDITDNEEDLPF